MKILNLQKLITFIVISFVLIALPSSHLMQAKSTSTLNIFDRTWTEQEVEILGYIPGEVLIEFQKGSIDLSTDAGKKAVKEVITEQSSELTLGILEKMIAKGAMEKADVTSELTDELKPKLIKHERNLVGANTALLGLAIDTSVLEIVEELEKIDGVAGASPNYIGHIATSASETSYSNGQLWGLKNTGATISSANYSSNNPDPGNSDPDINTGSGIYQLEAARF